MKRLVLMGASLAVFAGAVVYGSTGAFFSDSETSTGNTFTAGAIDLKVDSTQHYNNAICVPNTSTTENLTDYWWQLAPNQVAAVNQYPVIGSVCDGSWDATNLGAQKFFNFSDIKPGDQGEDTISLHVNNNDAYACADVSITENADNGINEPETQAGDITDGVTGGELAQTLTFVAWNDNGKDVNGVAIQGAVAGDNIHQAGEVLLFNPGPASNVLASSTLTLADASTGPLVGNATNYIGLAWCAGTIAATTGGGAPTCDGSTMGNNVQTDSLKANLTFRVEQARNNPNFTCTPQQEVPLTGTVTLDKIVTFSDGTIAGVDVSDYTLHLVGPGGDHILVDEQAFPGLTPGAYVVSEVYSGNPANVTSNATFSGSCAEIGTTDTATLNVVAGINPTCTITNSVTQIPG